MPTPTATTAVIQEVAVGLLAAAAQLIADRGLTLIGVALTNLADEVPIQLELGDSERDALDATLDRLRDRYGSAVIVRAALVGRDLGPTVPLLPD